MEEYEKIPEKETSGHAEFANDIDYNGQPVNMLQFWEERIVKGETVRTEFQWLTSIRITKRNAEKIAGAGRKRWKIENEGFNRQKNWQGDITHACSWDATAMKNHYLMTQIADMVKQLYEWFCLKARGIKKKKKKYIFRTVRKLYPADNRKRRYYRISVKNEFRVLEEKLLWQEQWGLGIRTLKKLLKKITSTWTKQILYGSGGRTTIR